MSRVLYALCTSVAHLGSLKFEFNDVRRLPDYSPRKLIIEEHVQGEGTRVMIHKAKDDHEKKS